VESGLCDYCRKKTQVRKTITDTKVPATWVVEAGGSLEPRGSGSAQVTQQDPLSKQKQSKASKQNKAKQNNNQQK
jgi:hypothetical protein